MNVKIEILETKDINIIVNAFANFKWNKPYKIFEEYLKEQEKGERIVWLAYVNSNFAGYITLKFKSEYLNFYRNNTPEIMDLNVLPPFRNQGTGSFLLDIAESAAKEKSDVVGIRVGLYQDYGSAQRLYVKRGYIPDGKGIIYDYKPVAPGSKVIVDDDLVLAFIKVLK